MYMHRERERDRNFLHSGNCSVLDINTSYTLDPKNMLGQGAFGTVYKIDDKTALKVVHVANNQSVKEKALEEIELMIKVSR